MYEVNADLSALRQGDIISQVVLPRLSIKNSFFLHSITHDGNFEFENKGIVDIRINFAVILSQCCEFNEGKRHAFSLAELFPFKSIFGEKLKFFGVNLAQLVPVSKSPFRERLKNIDTLRASNTIDPNKKNDAVHVYLFEEYNGILKEPHVADFTRVFSISMKEKQYILNNKILQLNDFERDKFQIKLSYFYGRRAK